MKILNSLATFVAALILAACGGGSDDPAPTAPTPVPVPPVAVVPEADVTFRQLQSAFLALPGETVRATVLDITCAGVMSGGYCPGPYPTVGQIVVMSSVELMAAKFTLGDGTVLDGWFQSEGDGKYRFSPSWNYGIWRTDTVTVDVTVSPYAKAGEHTLVVLEVGTPAPDMTVAVESAPASLTVYEVAAMAPMAIWASEAYQPLVFEKGGAYAEWKLSAECAPGTDCDFQVRFDNVYGLQPGSAVYLCNNINGCWIETYADENGEVEFDLYWAHYGTEEYTIRLFPSDEYIANGWGLGLYASEVKAWVGNKEILPKLGKSDMPFDTPETGCTVVTPNRCKG